MWIKITNIILVVLLLNFTNAAEKWRKSAGIASLACPLDDDPDEPTVLPFEGDCTKFIKCSYGRAYKLSCPQGLHWSKALNYCESPRVANCNANESTPKPSIGENGCSFSFIPHPSDCTKAIGCADGKTFDVNCIDGLYWDRTQNRCVLDKSVCP